MDGGRRGNPNLRCDGRALISDSCASDIGGISKRRTGTDGYAILPPCLILFLDRRLSTYKDLTLCPTIPTAAPGGRVSRKDSFAADRIGCIACRDFSANMLGSRNHVQLRTLLERGVRSLSTQRSEGTSFLCWSMCGRYRQKVDHVLPAGADGFPSAHSWEGGSAGAPQLSLLTASSVNQPVRSA